MSPPRLPPDRYGEFKELALRWSDERLGTYFGIGATTAARYRRRLGVNRPPLPKAKILTVEEQVILKRRWGKESSQALAVRLKRCVHTIRKYARLLGLPPQKPPCSTTREQERLFLRLVKNDTIPIRVAMQQAGVSHKASVRLRRQAGLMRQPGNPFTGPEFRPASYDPMYLQLLARAGRRAQLEAAEAARAAEEEERRPNTIRWRCWHCARVNVDTPTCLTPGCRAQLGRK